MAVYYIKRTETSHWHVYALVLEMGGKEFVVKVGVSSTPYERYETMMTALPFPSVMRTAFVGEKPTAYAIESKIHRAFKHRNTIGEWFRFRLDEKGEFHRVVNGQLEARLGEPPEWHVITPEMVREYAKLRESEKDPKRRRKKELAQFRLGT